jgi:hypothetical protein
MHFITQTQFYGYSYRTHRATAGDAPSHPRAPAAAAAAGGERERIDGGGAVGGLGFRVVGGGAGGSRPCSSTRQTRARAEHDMVRDSLQQLLLLLLAAAILSGGTTPAAGAHGQQIAPITALVRGWSSATSQGPWCDQSCILSNAAKLLTPNMSLEVDPFMQITDSVWPTVVTEGWWVPASGSGSAAAAVSIDAFGRPAPDPGRFPGSHTQGLGILCSILHGLRGTANNVGGLRCGADLVLGVPRSAVAAASPVLGAPHATAATIANRSNPLGSYYFSLNASAQGAAEYAQSLAQVMLAWRVDHVHVSSAGATWEPRWLPILRAFAVNFNRTAGNKRTLAIRGPGESTDPLLPGSELLDELRGLADSVAAGPPLWDTWPHVRSALILAKEEWRRVSHSSCGDQQPCARWDIGVLPIGRLGAVQGGNMTYPPWHAGSCTPVQLGCGDAVSAAPTVTHSVFIRARKTATHCAIETVLPDLC